VLTFGLYLSYKQLYPEQNGERLYEEMREQALMADQLGYDNLWFPEHHLIHFTMSPSALLPAVSIGAQVKCRVGTSVVILAQHHPLMFAGEIAQADRLLRGRLELGVARGAYKYEFDRFGINFDDSRARFEECLDILERLWRSEDEGVAYKGKFYHFESSYVWPRPVQKPHPPIWIGCMSAPSIERAVEQRYNVFHALFRNPMSQVETMADTFHSTRERLGIPRGEIRLAMSRNAFVVERQADLAKRAREALTLERINRRMMNFTQNADTRAYVSPDPNPGDPSETEILNNLIMGTPDQVLEMIEAYDAAGVDHISLWMAFGAPHEEVVESIRLFAEGVMKPYRDRHRDSSRPPISAQA